MPGALRLEPAWAQWWPICYFGEVIPKPWGNEAMPMARFLMLILALAFTAAVLVLAVQGMHSLEAWFESLSPLQQYWLPRVLIPVSALLVAWGGLRAYRRRARAEGST